MKKLLLVLFVIVAAVGVSGAEIIGRVVGVADGDTITVLDEMDNGRFRIRLNGIDSPEKKQAYGNKAKQYLSSLVYGKRVSVRFSTVDRYGRIVGRVYVSGKDISLAMLSAGYAWHYTQYDKSPEYAAAEKSAASARLGLWADRSPVPPWEFRRK
jgi:endonuclease YncB( thermonuclease family)